MSRGSVLKFVSKLLGLALAQSSPRMKPQEIEARLDRFATTLWVNSRPIREQIGRWARSLAVLESNSRVKRFRFSVSSSPFIVFHPVGEGGR